jgi:hypothetical protein
MQEVIQYMWCLSATSGACRSISAKSSRRSTAGRRKLCSIAAAIGLWVLSPCPATAGLVYITPSVSFNNSTPVATSNEGDGVVSIDNASLGTSALAQFDKSLGVLTGVTIDLLNSKRTQSITVSSDAGGGSNGNVTSSGQGSSTAALSAPGVSYTFTPAFTATVSCKGNQKNACSKRKTTTVTDTSQNLSATGSLDSYVGTGTVTVSRTAPTLSAEQLDNVFSGTETTQNQLTWAGGLSATYSYLLHAAPSFDSSTSLDSLTLDFGTVAQGSSVSPLGFSIFNLADSDRTGLDLLGFAASGSTSPFDSGLSLFANLLQGSNKPFSATLDTTNVGSFLATYTLTLSDAANIGAASSQSSYTLVLTLKGNVTDLSSVPVPDAVWLFGTGLVGLVGISRRKTPPDPE